MNAIAYHQFRAEFFDYMDRGARRSATFIVSLIAERLRPKSILDVGCGRGVWLSEWMNAGVSDCAGVDGPYVDRSNLAIASEQFVAWDLSRPLDLHRRFDLVQSLEVAQCIGGDCADVFIDSLCRHGEVIIFSAAVPGQGGEGHVNEQPLEYWCEKFLARGYGAFDWIRASISGMRQVEPWYRYNSLLFATDDAAAELPADVRAKRIAVGARIADVAPFAWRARNATLRRLPAGLVQQLAIVKHKLHNLLAG